MPRLFAVALSDERATSSPRGAAGGPGAAGRRDRARGPLGSGKTSFARAFIECALRQPAGGSEPDLHPRPGLRGAGRPPIWHFDLFRLAAPEEAWELGIEDAFADGISLIEWPERLGPLLPAERLEVALAFAATPEARIATIAPSPSWSGRVAELRHG